MQRMRHLGLPASCRVLLDGKTALAAHTCTAVLKGDRLFDQQTLKRDFELLRS